MMQVWCKFDAHTMQIWCNLECKHGATIAQLNEEELFYMRSRGLTLAEASKLQLSSYIQEVISSIPISKDRWDLLDKILKEN